MSIKSKKEPGVNVGIRLPQSIAMRYDGPGKLRGTEVGKLAAKFSILRKILPNGNNTSLPYKEELIYGTSVHRSNLYHITMKKGVEISTIELGPEDVAQFIESLVDLLNADQITTEE